MSVRAEIESIFSTLSPLLSNKANPKVASLIASQLFIKSVDQRIGIYLKLIHSARRVIPEVWSSTPTMSWQSGAKAAYQVRITTYETIIKHLEEEKLEAISIMNEIIY